MRVYFFQLRHFQHQPPDIVPEDNLPESAMPIPLFAFCVDARVERWCHRRIQFLATSPIAAVINAYCFCVRRQHGTPVFHAYGGTVREAIDQPYSIRFDTDYYRIGIDTFASGCVSHNREHFITYKASEGQECKGIAVGLSIKGRGTLKLRIDDDNGITDTINVPKSVHIPDLPMVLVSPQHWAQQMSDGIVSTSGAKSTILTFRGYRITIQYYAHSNTPSFRSSSGTLHYQYFAAMVEHGSTASKTLLRSENVVTDDESPSSEGASEGNTDKHDG